MAWHGKTDTDRLPPPLLSPVLFSHCCSLPLSPLWVLQTRGLDAVMVMSTRIPEMFETETIYKRNN